MAVPHTPEPAGGQPLAPWLAAGMAPGAVVLTGLVSLLPVGLYLAMFPGATRWIGVLDAVLLAIGIVLLRSDRLRSSSPG